MASFVFPEFVLTVSFPKKSNTWISSSFVPILPDARKKKHNLLKFLTAMRDRPHFVKFHKRHNHSDCMFFLTKRIIIW